MRRNSDRNPGLSFFLNIDTMTHSRLWSHVYFNTWDKARLSLLCGSIYLHDSTYKGETIKTCNNPSWRTARETFMASVHIKIWVTKQPLPSIAFKFLVEHCRSCHYRAWWNAGFKSRKSSHVCSNMDGLHSRAQTFTVAVKEKRPDKFWVEWQIPWGKLEGLQSGSCSFAAEHIRH